MIQMIFSYKSFRRAFVRAFAFFESFHLSLLQSTSRRAAQFLWVFKPLFGNALKIEIPEPTTSTTEATK